MGQPTEHEAYTRLIDALRIAEDNARWMAFLREDPRWIKVGALFATARDNVVHLATKRALS